MTIEATRKYRPTLHFAPKQNWMNDPNGLVYFEGEYHLFFQHNPHDTVHGPMYWGHAVSKDLIQWEELDIALHPDELGTMFSGSAVIDWHNTSGFFPEKPGIVAIFTHHLDRGAGKHAKESQSLAYSHDNGRTWTKYEGNPVLEHDTKIDFRDPKVMWHHETNTWVMVVASEQTISFYTSANLIDWQFESEFGDGIGAHDGVWECTDLFELDVINQDESKWVLIVSVGGNHSLDVGTRTQYYIGTFDGTTFTADPESIDWLDHGRDSYAGVSFSDIPEADGRRIYMAWMTNSKYAQIVPTEGWRGQMNLPRELSLRKHGNIYRLYQQPVRELDTYFTRKYDIHAEVVNQSSEKSYQIDAAPVDINLTIENKDASQYGIQVYHTDEQWTRIVYEAETNRLVLDRANTGNVGFSEYFLQQQAISLEEAKQLKLQIIVDASSIEVFVNDGAYALSSLVYPDQPCKRIEVFAADGSIEIVEGHISTFVKQ